MRYILNSAVITAPGTYRYACIPVELAQDWLKRGPYECTIGYAETCAAFESLLGVAVPMNRKNIIMDRGDEALVFRLVLPPGTPRITAENKGMLTPEFVKEHSEIGLLQRTE